MPGATQVHAGRCVAAATAVAIAVLAWTSAPAAADTPLEHQVKAAYLYKFGAYIEWPQDAFASATSPAVLCVVGEDPFGNILDETVNGQRIGDRPISVRRLKTVDRASGCQILFIADGSKRDAAQALAAVKGAGVLTVTDAASHDDAGIINFVVANNRVRFEIDDRAAAANGLTISSKLLSLAVSTKPRE